MRYFDTELQVFTKIHDRLCINRTFVFLMMVVPLFGGHLYECSIICWCVRSALHILTSAPAMPWETTPGTLVLLSAAASQGALQHSADFCEHISSQGSIPWSHTTKPFVLEDPMRSIRFTRSTLYVLLSAHAAKRTWPKWKSHTILFFCVALLSYESPCFTL